MQLQVWCGLPEYNTASFDPECLALALVLQANGLEDISIAATNSTLEGDLPALQDGTTRVHGLVEIANHLREQSLIRYSDLDVCAQFYADKLSTLSLYLLFESPKNYEQVTRPTISGSVPFPMQYNLTVSLQRDVQRRAAAHGLHTTSAPIEREKGLSKTHEKMLELSYERKVALRGTKRTSHVLAVAESLYSELDQIAARLAQERPRGLEKGDSVSPAYCLIAANLYLHSLALPDPVFKTILGKHTELAAMAQWAGENQPSVLPDNKYTLKNYLKWRFGALSSFAA